MVSDRLKLPIEYVERLPMSKLMELVAYIKIASEKSDVVS